MQGLAYMHSDLGGFAGANLDDELYVRWLQYGVFQPIYRPHAQEEVASEPIFRSDKAKALAKEAIMLRYKMLPYNYNLVFENNQTGKPLMQPLFFEEPENTKLQTYSETYLWGSDILVTPILKAEVKNMEVYFPKSSKWFDLYTDEKFDGGQIKTIQTKESSIPTYVRAGAFILIAKPMQSTKAYDGSNLELHYYHDASITESERYIYNDDGKTPQAFEKGQFEMLEFEFESKNKQIEIEFESEIGENYSTTSKHIELVIHNFQEEPKRIKVNNKKSEFQWDQVNRTLAIPVLWNSKNELEIKVTFKN
jgi:alpha-glucosidase (family GH31 glycosyl hydrolase)